MGNTFEGKTYVKGSHKTIQPKIATNVDVYKSQQRISTTTNIHRSQVQSQVSFIRQLKSEDLPNKKAKGRNIIVDDKGRNIIVDDIKSINSQGYDEFKYAIKKLPIRNKVKINQ